MRTRVRLALAALFAVCLLINCMPQTARSGQVPAAGERIYVTTVKDLTGLRAAHGWPSEAVACSTMVRAMANLRSGVVVEIRRCERFGTFQVVNDSLAATLQVAISLEQHSFANDSLAIPVNVTVRDPSKGISYSFAINASVHSSEQEPNRFHFLATSLAEYVRLFPYRALATHFYEVPGRKRAAHEEDDTLEAQ